MMESPSSPRVNIYDLDFAELQEVVLSWKQPAFRAQQIWKGIYESLWETPDQFTNIPSDLKSRLNEYFSFTNLRPETVLASSDKQTVKTLFGLFDERAIEAVLMGYDQRRTLCISSQAGCAMGCVFCATGQMGFKRNLSCGEIVEQVLYYARMLKTKEEKVTNVVLMGMGEPFHNYKNVIKAINILNDERGLNLGERRFTISTVGIVPMINAFAAEKRQINLAISLHTVDNELRSSMMPVNKKYPVEKLIEACKAYVESTHRRVTFEYALIEGVNDSELHARNLASRLRGLICHVNLIPLNPTTKFTGKGTSHKAVEAFSAILTSAKIPNTVRIRRGIDIQAGCGQLASQKE